MKRLAPGVWRLKELPMPTINVYLAEDWAFCERARAAGLPIFADPSIRLWHFGRYGYGWEDAGRSTERFDIYTASFHDTTPG